MGFIQFMKAAIKRLRAAGKTENEIAGILKNAAEKSTVNSEVVKEREPETALEPRYAHNDSIDSFCYALAAAGINAKEVLTALEAMRAGTRTKPRSEKNNWRRMHGLTMRRKCNRRSLRHGKRKRTDSRADNADMA